MPNCVDSIPDTRRVSNAYIQQHDRRQHRKTSVCSPEALSSDSKFRRGRHAFWACGAMRSTSSGIEFLTSTPLCVLSRPRGRWYEASAIFKFRPHVRLTVCSFSAKPRCTEDRKPGVSAVMIPSSEGAATLQTQHRGFSDNRGISGSEQSHPFAFSRRHGT